MLKRIGQGTLPHTTVGRDYAIPAAAIRKIVEDLNRPRPIAPGDPLPVPEECAGGACGWCKQCRGQVVMADDVSMDSG